MQLSIMNLSQLNATPQVFELIALCICCSCYTTLDTMCSCSRQYMWSCAYLISLHYMSKLKVYLPNCTPTWSMYSYIKYNVGKEESLYCDSIRLLIVLIPLSLTHTHRVQLWKKV